MRLKEYHSRVAASLSKKENRKTRTLEDGRKVKINAFPRHRPLTQ